MSALTAAGGAGVRFAVASVNSPTSPSSSSESETTRSSRKRLRKEDQWKSTKRKKLRNSGESYTSKAGKQVLKITASLWIMLRAAHK